MRARPRSASTRRDYPAVSRGLCGVRPFALVLLVTLPACGGLVAYDDRDPGLPRRADAATDTHDECPDAAPIALPDIVVLCEGMPDGMRCCATYGEDAAVTYAVKQDCAADEIWVR